MPRPAKIWLRKQTGYYCVTFQGKITKLSKDRKEAERKFHLLMAEKEEIQPTVHGPSFKKLAIDFLEHTQGDKNAETLAIQRKILKTFCEHQKAVRARDLRGHMVTRWLAHENAWRQKAGRKVWGESTKALAIKTIKAVCNWAVRQGHLTENPIKKLSSGKVARRDRVITAEEKRQILEYVTPDFADFLRVVDQTGARPYTEVGRLEARHIDFAAGTATLKEHKTARKTGRPRVLFFTPETLEILRRRAERYPVGLLFRTRRGSGWTRSNSGKWFREIRDTLGINICCYLYRHSRITQALVSGVPVEVVAELCGNTPQIIHRFYSHVAKDQAALRAAAQRAMG